MNCKKCGQELDNEARFCPSCGTPVEVTVAGEYTDKSTSTTTSINVNEQVEHAKEAIGDFADNMKKKEVEISGKKFNMLEVITFGSGILGIIACFLPFASATVSMWGYSQSKSVSLMDGGDGFIFIGLIIATCLFALIRKDLIALITAVIIAIMAFYEYSEANSVIGYGVSFSTGAYLLIVAAIGLLLGTLLVYLNSKKHG